MYKEYEGKRKRIRVNVETGEISEPGDGLLERERRDNDLLKKIGFPNPITNSNSPVAKEKIPPTFYGAKDPGGIDLSEIELILKDEIFVSSLNPADQKILLAAKALEKDNWKSLALLRIHEVIRLLKDGLITDIQNKELLLKVLEQLKINFFLDPQALQFLHFLQSKRPFSELKLTLSH